MAEALRPTPDEVTRILGEANFSLPESAIDEVFTVYRPNSWVFRSGDTVYKIRLAETPEVKERAAREARNFRSILGFYLLNGYDLGKSQDAARNRFTLLKMPFLGISLHVIGEELDLAAYGEEPVRIPDVTNRFSPKKFAHLLNTFEDDLKQFAGAFGLIHCDLAQNNAPNNIVYNSSIDRLLPIDAEAFTPLTPDSSLISQIQMREVRRWMELPY